MKKFILIIGILILSGSMIFLSCKKEDTAVTPVDKTPSLSFMTGTEYIYTDTTDDVNTPFKVGVLGSKNINTNIDLASFKVDRIFNGVTETVYEENNIGESSFSWESNEMTNSEVGEENWVFILKDYNGEKKEISFILTTKNDQPYTPVFSPTYLIVDLSGVEYLDFHLTCVTDDWEMIKVVVTYPAGLGSDAYIGSGQIITVGSPFTFSSYFPKIGGTWTFDILGSLKSGVHLNESFTATTTLTVPVK